MNAVLLDTITVVAIDIEAYRADLKMAEDEVYQLHLLRYMWKNMMAMVASKPELPKNSLVQNWFVTCYTRTLAIGIRRQSQASDNRQTVGSLLRRVKAHASDFTRDTCGFETVELWAGDTDGWLHFAPTLDDPLDPERVATVITTLEEGAAVALRWANKRVAHLDRQDADVTFDDLEAALVALRQAVKFLHALLDRGAFLHSVTPLATREWLMMFTQPWYDPARMEHIDPLELG